MRQRQPASDFRFSPQARQEPDHGCGDLGVCRRLSTTARQLRVASQSCISGFSFGSHGQEGEETSNSELIMQQGVALESFWVDAWPAFIMITYFVREHMQAMTLLVLHQMWFDAAMHISGWRYRICRWTPANLPMDDVRVILFDHLLDKCSACQCRFPFGGRPKRQLCSWHLWVTFSQVLVWLNTKADP